MSVSESILKIDQHSAKSEARMEWRIFSETVCDFEASINTNLLFLLTCLLTRLLWDARDKRPEKTSSVEASAVGRSS